MTMYPQASEEKERHRQRLRKLLAEGATSPQAGAFDADYFDGLRRRIRALANAGHQPRTPDPAP